MAALVLEVVELNAKHTAARLTGLVEICDVQTGIIKFDVVRKECDIRCRLFALMDTESDGEGNDSGTGNS